MSAYFLSSLSSALLMLAGLLSSPVAKVPKEDADGQQPYTIICTCCLIRESRSWERSPGSSGKRWNRISSLRKKSRSC